MNQEFKWPEFFPPDVPPKEASLASGSSLILSLPLKSIPIGHLTMIRLESVMGHPFIVNWNVSRQQNNDLNLFVIVLLS